MKTAIVGASGYAGEELVRLLARHPHANLAVITSRSLAGQALAEHIPQLRGSSAATLEFSASDPATLAADEELDTVFLALPHGVATEFAVPLIAAGKRVLDLSADFRLSDPAVYAEYYGHPHPAPQLLSEAAYVIPELAADGWQQRRLIACPGCYPTSILVPLIPLLRTGLVEPDSIVINSVSGISGAGKKPDIAFTFCERTASVKAYGTPRHRHLSEIEEQLSAAAEVPVIVQFTPHLVPMKRGIASTITARAVGSIDDLYTAWSTTYTQRPCVAILPPGQCPDTAHVVGTNRIDISAVHDPRTGNFVITSAEDNLLKGAGGQAVQIFNIINGWEETTGLL